MECTSFTPWAIISLVVSSTTSCFIALFYCLSFICEMAYPSGFENIWSTRGKRQKNEEMDFTKGKYHNYKPRLSLFSHFDGRMALGQRETINCFSFSRLSRSALGRRLGVVSKRIFNFCPVIHRTEALQRNQRCTISFRHFPFFFFIKTYGNSLRTI